MFKHKNKKRILSLSLAITMTTSVLPMSISLAEDNLEEGTYPTGIEDSAAQGSSSEARVNATKQTEDPLLTDAIKDEIFIKHIRKNYSNCVYESEGETYLKLEEANNLKVMNISHGVSTGITGITDKIERLDGIEHFPNLEILNCSNNTISNLDLNANTALMELYCFGNALSNLDLSGNTALTELYCSDNALSNLDLSANTALTELKCYDNEISNIDLSSNTALTYLDCSGNTLSNLDVSKNTELTSLDWSRTALSSLDLSANLKLIYLYCSGNALSNLDVSKNTALRRLYCYENEISTLDLSANTELWDLNCSNNTISNLDLSANTALTELYCYDNEISNLDLSANTALETLQCYDNEISNLDLSANTALMELYCYVNEISNLDVSKNTALMDLNCSGNALSNLDLSSNTALTYLKCSDNEISKLDLSNNTKLWELDCSNNSLAELDLSNNPNLDRYYTIANNQTINRDAKQVDNAWSWNIVEGFESDRSEIDTVLYEGYEHTGSSGKYTGEGKPDKYVYNYDTHFKEEVDGFGELSTRPDSMSANNSEDKLLMDVNVILTPKREPGITYYYDVTYDANTKDFKGKVPEDSNKYKKDDKVTVLSNGDLAREGYIFKGWNTKADGTGESYSAKDTFNITEDTTLYAQWKKEDILDKQNHNAYIIGYPDGTVQPDGNITRAEASAIYFRLLTDEAREELWRTKNNYTDVTKEAWYNNEVSTLSNAGVIKGYPEGDFKPDGAITRAEFASMTSRFLSDSVKATNGKLNDIADHWAEKDINKLVAAGIIEGYEDGSFKPDKSITRAEAAKIVNGILERTPHKDGLLKDMKVWKDNNEKAWYYIDIQEATNTHEYERKTNKDPEKWTKILEGRDWNKYEKELEEKLGDK